MLAAVPEPVHVIVKSTSGTWTIVGGALIALLGSLVVAGAAVFAARLAARSANERQQAQLDADFERLKAQLAEERRLRSDERTRDSIDALVMGVHDTMDKLAALGVPAQGGEETRAELRQKIAADEGAAKETHEKELRQKEGELWEASIALVDQARGMLALETSASSAFLPKIR